MIDTATLIVCGVGPAMARLWASPIGEACERHNINTKVRVAAFLAQVCYESNFFTHTEENLYYTTAERIRALWPTRVRDLEDAATLCRNSQALANRVYSNRLGNGDESSNDGWNFRGRGPIQLTGRFNYKVFGDVIGVDYIAHPELVALPLDGSRTAAQFWESIHGNVYADNSDIDTLTKKINGGTNGAAERRARFESNLKALP